MDPECRQQKATVARESSGSSLSSPAPVTSVLTRIHPHAPAILIMVTALCLAATGGALMKQLASELPPVLLAWFRFSIYVVILIPLAFWRAGRACLRPSRPVLQVVRGLLLAAGNISFILGVVHVDYANAIAILYVYPFLMVGLSALILDEPVSRPAWAGVAGGFCGVLLVIHARTKVVRKLWSNLQVPAYWRAV